MDVLARFGILYAWEHRRELADIMHAPFGESALCQLACTTSGTSEPDASKKQVIKLPEHVV
jgi:hypothetical protein